MPDQSRDNNCQNPNTSPECEVFESGGTQMNNTHTQLSSTSTLLGALIGCVTCATALAGIIGGCIAAVIIRKRKGSFR